MRFAILERAAWAAAIGLQIPSAAALDAVPSDGGTIAARSLEASGGSAAWSKVRGMRWSGRVEGGSPQAPSVPFILEFERPNKTRYEIDAPGHQSIRVFDGRDGWKISTSDKRKPMAFRYTPGEIQFARAEMEGIGGILVECLRQDCTYTLEEKEALAQGDAYRLLVHRAGTADRHVWIDVDRLLPVQFDRPARGPAGQSTTLLVKLRNYRDFGAVKVPTLLETETGAGTLELRMVLEKVEMNPAFDASRFSRPAEVQARDAAQAGVSPPRP